MARYAEIQDTEIINVITADEDFINQHKPDAIICPEWIGVGDKYENGKFSRVVRIVTESDIIDVEEVTPTPALEG